ncbi:MAG: hypothetical protein RL199_1791, partial [Pseudomonadota bacterium]
RIEAVGRFEDLYRLSPQADVIDAGDGAVWPGLVDGHAHPLWLGRSLESVDLTRAHAMADVGALCLEWAASHPDGWVLGRGWDETRFRDAAPVARDLLDTLFPYRPVMLTRADEHAVLVNAAALRVAGITNTTPDLKGGRVGREASGKATGILVDRAIDFVKAVLPAPTRADRERWILAAARHALGHGLTGVHDACVDPETDEAYLSLAAAGALPIRTYAMADGLKDAGLDLVRQGLRPERGLYGMRTLKLFADGSLGSRGAQFFTPYADEPSTCGLAVQSDDELFERAALATQHGFQVAVHAIGDRACARTLSIFERLVGEGLMPIRPRLEHAQVLCDDERVRAARLGVVCAMQPVHAASDVRFALERLGPARLRGAYAWRSMLRHGVPLAFGSDFPVESARPLDGLAAAVRDAPGARWGERADESLTLSEAVDAYTRGNAFASMREAELGVLRPGALADVTVLDADPHDVPAWERIGVVATIVDGCLR